LWRSWNSRLFLSLMGSALLLCLVPLASLLFTLWRNGSHILNFRFLTRRWAPLGQGGGIAHAALGSLCLLGVASMVAVPLGLAKGLFLSHRGETRLARLTRLLLDVMSGTPAIIVGVFV